MSVAAIAMNESLRGTLKFNEPMARHTSWRVGGVAERFYQPADVDDLACFLRGLPPGEQVFWLGLGSNLLVRDGGLRGTVICTSGVLGRLHVLADARIRVEAGVPCPKVARQCAQHSLRGAEFLAGIPGTMGGALAMNAGAFGDETWNHVVSVETINARGERFQRVPADYNVGYRTVRGPNEWFVAAVLQFEAGECAAATQRIKELLARRAATQPTNVPNAGSVFRNPPGDHAARLIEACGLKGYGIGGARVSPKHANFIVNEGNATASDIEALIEHVAATVARIHGVKLVREVRIVGEPAATEVKR
ncbi:MAG: UDP-N-acetylenolpyruvoylglucosamine reductase [Gammaproteobacteria bacterium SG8_47]|nr:MAG: UDP-N-acetylenolpyruvoylglucosamine reductase [Gammaproteobacteria bacterium SG8_47]